jgi:hypothetical protein
MAQGEEIIKNTQKCIQKSSTLLVGVGVHGGAKVFANFCLLLPLSGLSTQEN